MTSVTARALSRPEDLVRDRSRRLRLTLCRVPFGVWLAKPEAADTAAERATLHGLWHWWSTRAAATETRTDGAPGPRRLSAARRARLEPGPRRAAACGLPLAPLHEHYYYVYGEGFTVRARRRQVDDKQIILFSALALSPKVPRFGVDAHHSTTPAGRSSSAVPFASRRERTRARRRCPTSSGHADARPPSRRRRADFQPSWSRRGSRAGPP